MQFELYCCEYQVENAVLLVKFREEISFYLIVAEIYRSLDNPPAVDFYLSEYIGRYLNLYLYVERLSTYLHKITIYTDR